jgi:hypothetical protein
MGILERRETYRRDEDKPKPMYMSGTIICSWLGMAASVVGTLNYQEDMLLYTSVMTLLTSFGAFLFRLFERSRIE